MRQGAFELYVICLHAKPHRGLARAIFKVGCSEVSYKRRAASLFTLWQVIPNTFDIDNAFRMETEFEINGGTTVYVYPSQRSVEDILQSKVEATDRSDHEDPFFVVNLGRLAALYNQVCHCYNKFKLHWGLDCCTWFACYRGSHGLPYCKGIQYSCKSGFRANY